MFATDLLFSFHVRCLLTTKLNLDKLLTLKDCIELDAASVFKNLFRRITE